MNVFRDRWLMSKLGMPQAHSAQKLCEMEKKHQGRKNTDCIALSQNDKGSV